MNPGQAWDDEVTELFRTWSGAVLGYLVSRGCDEGLAEEITSDAFLAARRQWARVRTFDRPEAYIFKIARHERSKRQKAHDIRAKDLRPDPAREIPDPGQDPADGVADHDAVVHALRQLPRAQQQAVGLRDLLSLSEAETAEILGVSTGSVKRYTSDGRHRLRLLLADFRPHSEEG